MSPRQLSSIRKSFPILSRRIHGRRLAYLDNASTTHKPQVVLDALQNFYSKKYSNIHRGIHTLSEESTELYEETRRKVAGFIRAKTEREIVFTKSCTESINLVAHSWGKIHIGKGDEVIVSSLEHHANLVPWQVLAKERGARLSVIPLTKELNLDQKAYENMLSEKTRLVCITAQSNVLGVIPPLKKMIKKAHEAGAKVLVDGAQSVGHRPTNVQSLGCDFFVFSAHKMCGPTGVGVLYARGELLDTMTPYQYGGDMVTTVGQYASIYREAPWRFEAGTPNIADVVAYASALDFLNTIGLSCIDAHDQRLLTLAQERFLSYPQVTPFLSKGVSNNILSFSVAGVHPHDVATVFDAYGVAIRSGLHCAEPLIHQLGVAATARMSMYLYNTEEDIYQAERALQKVLKIFSLEARS